MHPTHLFTSKIHRVGLYTKLLYAIIPTLFPCFFGIHQSGPTDNYCVWRKMLVHTVKKWYISTWVTDDIINAAQLLLHNIPIPLVGGLQNPIRGTVCSFDIDSIAGIYKLFTILIIIKSILYHWQFTSGL